MSDFTLVRRQNVLALFQRFAERALAQGVPPKGLEQDFAARLQISPSMWSQIKSARPLTEGFSPAILAALGALDTPAVLATIVSRHGSTPREVGSKMLLLPDGRTVGSVGGGIMEYRVQQLAAKMLAGEEPPTKLAAFTTDGTGEDAAIAACGGSMNVLLQRMETEENSDEA